MSTVLRTSGQLGRLSRATLLRVASRSPSRVAGVGARLPSAHAALVSRYRLRPYSTDPKPPADESKDAAANKEAEGGKQEPPKADLVKLSEEDSKMLEEEFAFIKKGLPQEAVAELEKTVEVMKTEGVAERSAQQLKDIREGNDGGFLFNSQLFKTQKILNIIIREKKRAEGVESDGPFLEQIFTRGAKRGPDGKQQSGGNAGKGPWPQATEVMPKDLVSLMLYAVGAWMVYRMIMPSEASREITWQELQTAFLNKGLVEKLVVVNGDRVRVSLHREAVSAMYPESPAANPSFHYYFSIGSVEAFERRLDDAQNQLGIPPEQRIPVSYSRETSAMQLIYSFGPSLLLIGGTAWLLRQTARGSGSQGGIFGMGKSRAKMFNHEQDIKVKFADVAGMDEAKVEIMEFVSFLKNPGQYQKLGAKIPRGAILSGPPGTGKTLLAKATAGESQVPFYSVSGSEFVEMFVGVGPSRVRDLFATARKNTPCIIFIDEIDAIGKSRSKGNFGGGGNDERESTLNQILTEMDGFNTSDQVVVLAGTNRPDILDSALMRPGRFDRHISIDRPTMDGRQQIFGVYLKKIVTNEDIEYLKGRLAALTPGFAGADIANCVNEAALVAARSSASSVEMKHFEQAIERVIGGLEKKSLVLSPEDKKTVAYHEAGHAICGWYFKYADPLLKVSIIPRGQGALGYAQYLPSGDTYLMNVNQLMDRMAMTLGGRVSEELHFDTVTSGASDDFNKVTRMATAMVTKWGMSKKVGPLHFEDNDQKLHKPFAESTAQTIDAEVRRIVDEAYKQCRDLLSAKKAEIGLIAEELLEKEVLTRDDLVRILGKRPFGDPKEFEKYFGGEQAGGKSAPPPFPTESTDSPPEYPSPSPAFRKTEERL